ncbi:glutamate--cysteine ligase catalytic subunit [Rozella allomycis CSF55]|uniref:Glutamate--cysteine ligase n=1 Tax=Rozella allomycis (strain CSF55) TaxID=988480 RepID=A0A075AN02_ROZAC|nr:Glutamate-cysteine ligase catalytic subunit domain-containing protein [Rozella allomycis CSF55]RKP20994.1 glutamate--cysteine ligase catalytic subunit [Rozella allomycis CSF55]|eukprot:EPZ31111.1 Glutamate-cysteine ligase catalytic subunit domain-containing protein [Rozella allomycis CSF55]
MGLLSLGTPLLWQEAKTYAEHVRDHGIEQFLNVYHRVKDRNRDGLFWGDEVEYMLLYLDHEKKNVKVNIRAEEILKTLRDQGHDDVIFQPEYGRYMIEATPGKPFGSSTQDLLKLESNMRKRRELINSMLRPNEFLITLTSFPLLGTSDFIHSEVPLDENADASHSLFIPDNLINMHARFKTLTRNIRERRGEKVAINVPVFRDTNTNVPFVEEIAPHKTYGLEGTNRRLNDHIYLDCMCFGMGCCCLQVTFQACNISEARKLYDALAVLTPIMMALSAASPIHKGYLADTDCRWKIISGSVDDRTDEERGLKDSNYLINKSRYDSIDSFISNDDKFKSKYNDINLVKNEKLYRRMRDNGTLSLFHWIGVDELLASHMAHLFIRDPLVVYKELIDQDDKNSSDHFENIQSTNWQTMRFKPPTANSSIGWRIEFRSMEVQLTDFENAAYALFIVLLTRAILSFNLNLYIPISKVDQNMQRGQVRDAVLKEKFYFRNHLYESKNTIILVKDDDSDEFEEMTIDEIINGKENVEEFPGLIAIVESYLETLSLDVESQCRISKYLCLISGRAKGSVKTMANWTRHFVTTHPLYKHDSKVPSEVIYDFVQKCKEMTENNAFDDNKCNCGC